MILAHKHLAAGVALLLGFAVSAVADLAIVIVDRADLFRGKTFDGYLAKDEVVHVTEHAGDRDWFRIHARNGSYDSRRTNFRTQTQIFQDFRSRQSELETELEKANEQLKTNFERALQLHASVLQIEWDRTVFVQTSDPIVIEKAAFKKESDAGTHILKERHVSGDKVIIPRYKRFEKITELKAKQLTKKWHKALAEIEDSNEILIRDRTRISTELSEISARFNRLTRKFDRFVSEGDDYIDEHYMVHKRNAGLFEDRKRVFELRRGDMVVGRPSRAHNDRLFVYYLGTWYDTPKKAYLRRSEIEIEHAAEATEFETKIENLENDVVRLRKREKILIGYMTDLERASSIKEEFVPFLRGVLPDELKFSREYYWLHRPLGSEEVIFRGRASRTLKKWQKRLVALQDEADHIWSKLSAVKSKLVKSETEHLDLVRRFDMVTYF